MRMSKAEHYYREGILDNCENRFEEAYECYSKAIESNPTLVEALLQRGILGYKILKRYRDALSDFNKILEIDISCAAAYLHRGIVKCNLRLFNEALPDFDQAIRLQPNDERAYYNRGKNKYMLKFSKEEVCADLELSFKLGALHAADMIRHFYGENEAFTAENSRASAKKKVEISEPLKTRDTHTQ